MGMTWRRLFLAALFVLPASSSISNNSLFEVSVGRVQHAFDRQVDLLVSPVWHVIRPVQSLMSYLFLSPVRWHFRLESIRAKADASGARSALVASVNDAADHACEVLRRFAKFVCPEVLVVRGSRPRITSFTLGIGRKLAIVVTDSVPEILGKAELRFAIGQEIGHTVLHHGVRFPSWALVRFAADLTALPRYLISRARGKRRLKHRESKARHRPPSAQAALLRELADGFAGACELFRGARDGRWPGLVDLDLDRLLLGGSSSTGYDPLARPKPRALDTAAALCTKMRMPGGPSALGAAAVGLAAPRFLAFAFDLDSREEMFVRRGLKVSAWALGVSAGKLRTEVMSADRLGLLVADGNVEAAVRSMVKLARNTDAAAMAALIGVRQLIDQAEVLDRALPSRPFDTEPSLPSRIANLVAWSHSPTGIDLLFE